jgi:Skp family chaperone for outer membrane proteins
MHTRLRGVFVFVLALGLLTPTVQAADEPQPASPPGHLVAVLDYDAALQNSRRYKQELEKLKASTAAAENELKRMHEQVNKLEQVLKTLPPSSPDYRKREEEVTFKQHELQARIKIERKKFEEERVQVEASILKDIDAITKQVAVANKIALVLNVSTRKLPLNSQEEVQRLRQQSIVYYNPSLDLTPLVQRKLDELLVEKNQAKPN